MVGCNQRGLIHMIWDEIFEYKDGKLFWKAHRSSNAKVGDEAGSTRPDGYRRVKLNKRAFLIHRVIREMFNGPTPPGMQIDHINGIKSDNRIENLRPATNRQNSQNMPLHRNGRLSGCMYDKRSKGWQAGIRINYKRIHIGCFDTEQEAHEAYKKACDNIHLYDGDGGTFRRLVREAPV